MRWVLTTPQTEQTDRQKRKITAITRIAAVLEHEDQTPPT